jgi:hypothetical protein
MSIVAIASLLIYIKFNFHKHTEYNLYIRCPILDNVYNLARRTSVLEDAFQIY